MFRKIFYGISLLALLVIAGGYGFLRTKLPQRSGEIKLSGLKSKVDVVFDKWGIPHIEAENEQDAYHALGYLNAQDRIFQLEFMVRVAHVQQTPTYRRIMETEIFQNSSCFFGIETLVRRCPNV